MAVGASAAWGASEFVAGVASRTRSVALVLAGSQVASLVIVGSMVLVAGAGMPAADAVLLAAAAGVFEVLGCAALYKALASGPMGPVAPVAALGGLVPLSVGLAGGDPLGASAAVGVVLGLGGIVLVSWEGGDGGGSVTTRPLLLAGAASVCFGLFFLLLQLATLASDPMAAVGASRVAAVLVTVPFLFAILRRDRGGPPVRIGRLDLVAMVSIGALDVAGNTLYAVGTSQSDAVGLQVIASTCPVATVLLAQIVLRERMNAVQTAGVWLTILAVMLVGGV